MTAEMEIAHRQDTSYIDCPELFRLLHGQRQWESAAERKRAYHLFWQKCNPERVNANARSSYQRHQVQKKQKSLLNRLQAGAKCRESTLHKYNVHWVADKTEARSLG